MRAALLAAVLVVPLLHGADAETTEAWQGGALRALGALALGAALVGFGDPSRVAEGGPPRVAAWAALGLCGWAGLSACAAGPRPEVLAFGLALAGAVGLSLAVRMTPLGWLCQAAFLAASVVEILALAGPARHGPLAALARPLATFAEPATLGVALAPVGVAAVALSVVTGSRLARCAALGAGAGVVASMSRGALLALAAGACVVLLGAHRPRVWVTVAALVAGGAVALGAHLVAGRGELLVLRANPFVEVRDVETPRRPELGRLAIRLVAARPLLGHGPGVFPWVIVGATARARDEGLLDRRVEPWPHAQNDLLELAATLGIPGATLALVLGSALVFAAWQRRRQADGLAALGMLVALAAAALLHHPLETAVGKLEAAVAAGLALGPISPRRSRDAPRAGRLGLVAGLVVALLGLTLDDHGFALARARALTRAGRPAEALSEWRTYHRLAPALPKRDVRLATAELRAGHAADGERRIRAVLSRWPFHERARVVLGELLLRRGDRAEALRELALVTSRAHGPTARSLERAAPPSSGEAEP